MGPMFLIPRFHNLSPSMLVPGLQMYKPRNAPPQCVSVHLFHVLCPGAGVFTVFKHLKLSGACDYRVFAPWGVFGQRVYLVRRGIQCSAVRPSIPLASWSENWSRSSSWSSLISSSSREALRWQSVIDERNKTGRLILGPSLFLCWGTEPQDLQKEHLQVQLLRTPWLLAQLLKGEIQRERSGSPDHST